ncbi:hypothetical protein NGM37_11010, partial [Streptomyces sp. TRM76130]|nr:hypothetical protein [Streptomyces sp. TRM76130]
SALHLEACRAARPDPRDLADWLITQALGDANDLFDVDPLDYTDVLGPRGTALLRDEALRAWRANRTGWA